MEKFKFMPKYSVIIPVYNRPEEVKELLDSLTNINFSDFEIIIIEDGSTNPSEEICKKYNKKLQLQYYFQENRGPGPARNKGASLAKGEFFVFFDSDCIIPAEYFNHVEKYIDNTDCFGGPDKAHTSFSNIQKAINYSMTSLLTTGGIRGGKKKLDKFYPRSFNMGIKNKVYKELQGFAPIRFGEDLDFSMRIIEHGYKTLLINDAWVFHKRRNNFKSFFKQVHNSGIARINLNLRHPGSLKLVHWMPALFTIGYIFGILLTFIFHPFIYLLAIVPLAFFTDCLISSKSLKTSFLAIFTSFTQLFGYGSGFLSAFFKRIILKKEEFTAFEKNFYK